MDIKKIARDAALRCANDNNVWYGYDRTAEIIAEVLEVQFPKPPVGFVEAVCPTTGRRDRYALNADGSITIPFRT